MNTKQVSEKQINVHITPHMHWDREWYFTAEHSRVLLVNNMEEILTRLENDPDYPFYVLDGQTAILEDYFAVKPEAKERVERLVQQKKLIIGPWYTQTDLMMVGAESITRNLLYGMKDCQPFGEVMEIGYLPDSFGMSQALPQILNGFGIDTAMFWRGCSERHGTHHTEFVWQSVDGSEVIAQVLPLGYAIGKYLPEDKEALYKRLNSYLEVLEKASFSGDLLLPNGHDQMPIQQNIFQIIELLKEIFPERTFLLSRFETIFDKLKAQKTQLPRLTGEFNDGKYMRVHRTISSTRMDIKLDNARVENKISNLLEPAATIAYALGCEYHHGLIEKMWKEIMKNHAHDSISCCCSDPVHQEIKSRFWLADDMAENLLQFYLRKIVDNMPKIPNSFGEGVRDRLAFFNFLPYSRKEIVNATIRIRATDFQIFDAEGRSVSYAILTAKEIDPGLVDRQIVHYGNYDPFMEYDIQLSIDLPAMGYTALSIEKSTVEKAAACVIPVPSMIESHLKIENEFYQIELNKNGTINVINNSTGQRFDNALLIEEGSDDGDEYDYSPSREEWLLNNLDCQADIKLSATPWQQKARIAISMPVPNNLQSRAQKIKDGLLEVMFTVTLTAGDPKIAIEVEWHNQADDHRVRILFPYQWISQNVIADTQFGTISRPVKDDAMNYWEEEGWKEAPIPVWQLLNFVAVEETNDAQKTQTMALFTEGLREFEVIEHQGYQAIALTLFRSIGVLGKENLLLRPGRPSGIKLPTPDSQMRGRYHARIGLGIFDGSVDSVEVMRLAKAFNTPVCYYNKIPYDAMKLNLEAFQTPIQFSLLEMQPTQLTLSAIKKAEQDETIIIRWFNPSHSNSSEEKALQINLPHAKLAEVNLAEKELSESKNLNNGLGVFKPNQVRSFSVKLTQTS
ncbi:mannosylglycerate hydrolase [Thorsellia anophelis]|uniref:Mannosylglycerate hydrolase n=1 Tax=Thorsellia anophelis DSM 18579 TaxID=1123402 RepID=A0A1H9YEU1_9GAMM|nr:mannosylglycerate hydrolase [Thorsellia anophelis]SES67532.1 mannosylglycerate hydrolase [Thorsellia anophelis DSM 18579]